MAVLVVIWLVGFGIGSLVLVDLENFFFLGPKREMVDLKIFDGFWEENENFSG